MKILLGLLLLLSSVSKAETIEAQAPFVSYKTNKVVKIIQDISQLSADAVVRQFKQTRRLPGERLIIIQSPGGDAEAGQLIIDEIKLEQILGTKIVCFVAGIAHSMAFNILTHCDVRISTPRSMFLVHKIRYYGPFMNVTAQRLRELAGQLDEADEPYRQANSKAMSLSLQEYDSKADAETTWSAETLRKKNYIHYFGKLKK